MINRNERGKLTLNTLDATVMFDDLFAACKDEDEVEFLYDRFSNCLERAMEDAIEQMKEEC